MYCFICSIIAISKHSIIFVKTVMLESRISSTVTTWERLKMALLSVPDKEERQVVS
jgi:hypothetical protein